MAKIKGLSAIFGTVGGGNSHQRRLRFRHPELVRSERLSRQERRRQKSAEALARQEREYRSQEEAEINFPAGWDTFAGLQLEPAGFFHDLRSRLSAWFRRI